jgi:hypothetical protein
MATPHFLHFLGRAVWATHANCEAASWLGERYGACRLALLWSGCRPGCIAQARRFHEAGCACATPAATIWLGSRCYRSWELIGPVLLMFGLTQTSASIVATALIAWFVSREFRIESFSACPALLQVPRCRPGRVSRHDPSSAGCDHRSPSRMGRPFRWRSH